MIRTSGRGKNSIYQEIFLVDGTEVVCSQKKLSLTMSTTPRAHIVDEDDVPRAEEDHQRVQRRTPCYDTDDDAEQARVARIAAIGARFEEEFARVEEDDAVAVP